MSTKVQVIGGGFQDSEGAVLANGYLILRLNQDSVVNTSQICAGIETRLQLDSDGNVASSTSTPAAPNQFVWGNDQLLPVNSFYRMTGYDFRGQLSWGPNNVQIIGDGGTFDIGTITPNTVFSWQPPIQPLLLETNGVQNSDQTLLDLVAGTNVTLSNVSGHTTISASSGSISSGSYFYGPGIIDMGLLFGSATLGSSVSAGFAGGSIVNNVVVVYKFTLPIGFTISKVTTQCTDNLGGTSTFGIYTEAGAKVVDGGSFPNVTASIVTNTITPVVLPPGVYWHAQATTLANNAHFPGFVFANNSIVSGNIVPFFMHNSVKLGTAANPLSAGVLPATLGVVTPFTPQTNADGICCPLYE